MNAGSPPGNCEPGVVESASVDACWRVPVNNAGRFGPMDRARVGSEPLASSHRPTQPLVLSPEGSADCMISIDAK